MQIGVVYARLHEPTEASFFLFGPRGTGKSAWVKKTFPKAFLKELPERL